MSKNINIYSPSWIFFFTFFLVFNIFMIYHHFKFKKETKIISFPKQKDTDFKPVETVIRQREDLPEGKLLANE